MLTASLLVFAAALTIAAGATTPGLPEPEDMMEPLPSNGVPESEDTMEPLPSNGVPESEDTVEPLPSNGVPESEDTVEPLPSNGVPESEDTTETLPSNVEHGIAKRWLWKRFWRWSLSCKRGWKRANGRCFLYVSTPLSWANAERNCQARGGNLASVHSLHEYKLIRYLIKKICRSNPTTWLGGSDGQEEGYWFWSDGSRFKFHYWHHGEPNNLHNEDCLEMNFGGQKKFNDQSCKDKRPSVCAIKAYRRKRFHLFG